MSNERLNVLAAAAVNRRLRDELESTRNEIELLQDQLSKRLGLANKGAQKESPPAPNANIANPGQRSVLFRGISPVLSGGPGALLNPGAPPFAPQRQIAGGAADVRGQNVQGATATPGNDQRSTGTPGNGHGAAAIPGNAHGAAAIPGNAHGAADHKPPVNNGAQNIPSSSQAFPQNFYPYQPNCYLYPPNFYQYPQYVNQVPTPYQQIPAPPNNSFSMDQPQLADAMQQLVLKTSLPPLEVVKFDGNPIEFPKFCSRFMEMVGSQALSDTQKMTRLIQFLDGGARRAVAGLEGVDGGFSRAMKVLKERYGQPHMIAQSCVDCLMNFPNLSNDSTKLREFADKCRVAYETLNEIEALSEMNMSNLAKITGKLPIRLQARWRDKAQVIRENGKLPNFQELVNFVERCAEAENDPVFGKIGEGHSAFKPVHHVVRKEGTGYNLRKTTTLSTNVSEGKQGKARPVPCVDCGREHRLSECPQFQAKNYRQRQNLVRLNRLCLNCLKKGHFARDCHSKPQCERCGETHATLLHKEYDSASFNPPSKPADVHTVHAVSAFEMRNSRQAKVALQVVPVRILGEGGQEVTTFALLDTGSEESFIGKELADKLKLHVHSQQSLAISTMSGETTIPAGRVNFTVEGVRNPMQRVHIAGVKVDKLNISTSRPIDLHQWSHLEGINVEDVEVADIKVLIGANVPEAQVHIESRIGRKGEPYAVRTVLGWTVFGPIGQGDGEQPVRVNKISCEIESLDQQMQQYLGMENVASFSNKKGMSVEDARGLKILDESTKLVDGRFEVAMLWKGENPWLPNNRNHASTRLMSLRRKLEKNPPLRQKYTEFIDKLFDKGYARKMTEEEYSKVSPKTWYLPHHAVFHPQKPTKIRVVFDAAAKYDGVSLNSQLLQGPDLTNSLLGILLRFRERAVAIVGDIEGMFLQVQVPTEDTEALRFLWWEKGDVNGKIVECKMLRHIFGAADSPSCCSYALKQTAEMSSGFTEEAMEAVKRDFYVDDLVKSVDTPEAGISLVKEITAMLEKAGFRITGWLSNSREVVAAVPESERAKQNLNLDLDNLPISRALGVEWDVQEDVFQFDVNLAEKPATKRGVLSTLSSLYDPIGFVSPVILEARNIMQRLWKHKPPLDWDDPLPAAEMPNWERWKRSLPSLSGVKIPRYHLVYQPEVEEITLHNFSDASTVGYGMCAYLRFKYPNGDVSCSFLIGRSRCAPIKITTIPRLELLAATLSARISATVMEEMSLDVQRVIFWTDSQTVLQYITNQKSRFQVFVANRVAAIRESTSPDQWHHCPGEQNPADDASRGLNPEELKSEHRWLKGPSFLWQSEDNWPGTTLTPLAADDPELRKEISVNLIGTNAGVAVTDTGLHKMIMKTGSWDKLKRVIAWTVRFCWGLKARQFRRGTLTQEELDQAELVIVKSVQEECFPEEIGCIQDQGVCKSSSKLGSLGPILVSGALRVGGRLDKAPTLTYDEKHPLIIPKKHHICVLIARSTHREVAHAGQEQVLAETRKKFWLIGGRRLIKRLIRECRFCRERNARLMTQIMAPLPMCRLVPFKPAFSFTGVDLFGPLFVKMGRSTVKRWGCLFTCMNTRAVFLEVAQSLGTDDFILVLRQFICRRGPPEEIRSDNGSNFSGTDRELREAVENWNQEKIEVTLQQRGVKWVFHPPTAAHMSGVWERLIKSTKGHLKALAGDRLLTDYGLRTFLVEAEAIMNGRPICPVSEDPQDFEALTPNHFLLHRKVVGLPPGIFVEEDKLLRKEWRKIQYLLDLFWNRWLREYLPSLQQREKWRERQRNLREGDLVLLAEDGVKRGHWPLGRVQEVFPGSDGMVRSAKVKTAVGEYHRPIVKLCLIEGADEDIL